MLSSGVCDGFFSKHFAKDFEEALFIQMILGDDRAVQATYVAGELVYRRDRDNPFAWYQLGVVYEARGDPPRARLASAEQQVMNGQYVEALRSALMRQPIRYSSPSRMST